MTLLEFTGAALVLLSIYLYGRLSIWGPIHGITSAIVMTIISIEVNLWFIVVMNVIVAAFHLKNLINWNSNAPKHHRVNRQEAVR